MFLLMDSKLVRLYADHLFQCIDPDVLFQVIVFIMLQVIRTISTINCHVSGVVYQALPALYTTASSIPIIAPAAPNPGDPWDGGWLVDEGTVVVRVGAGSE